MIVRPQPPPDPLLGEEGARGRLHFQDLLGPIEPPRRGVAARDYRAACALLAFVCVSALLTHHILREAVGPAGLDGERWGLVDFRDAVFYPVRALLDGNNPYDAPVYTKMYPVSCVFPMYSPLALILYLPFGWLSFQTGAVSFLLLNIALSPILAGLVLRMCGLVPTVSRSCILATLILVSRGGYVNLFLGQSTTYVVLAAYAALYWARERAWLSGVALALATLKPTFGGPLAVLMLAKGDVRATLIGLTLAAVGAALPAAVLAYNAGGVWPFLASLATSHQVFAANSTNNLVSSPLRVDTPALVGRLLSTPLGPAVEVSITAAVLVLGALCLWRLSADDEAWGQLSTTLVCLTALTCTYHQVYDLPLLTLPIVALATARWAPQGAALRSFRWPLLLLLGLPLVNYLMSRTALEALGITRFLQIKDGWVLALASVNGVALLGALLLCTALAIRRQAALSDEGQPSQGRSRGQWSQNPRVW